MPNRRDFLKTSSVAMAAAAVGELPQIADERASRPDLAGRQPEFHIVFPSGALKSLLDTTSSAAYDAIARDAERQARFDITAEWTCKPCATNGDIMEITIQGTTAHLVQSAARILGSRTSAYTAFSNAVGEMVA